MVSQYSIGVSAETLLVTPVQSLMQAVPSRKQLEYLIRTLKPGDALEPEKLIVWLAEHGYNRLDQVEVPGDFAVRGGIVDVYLAGDFAGSTETVGLTARIDFFGDAGLESIKHFDPDSMGSLESLDSLRLVDLKGQLPESGESVSMLSYLPDEAVVILWAPLEIAEQAKSYLDRLPDAKGIYPLSAVLRHAERFVRLEMSQFDQAASASPSFVRGVDVKPVHLPIASLQRFETEAKKAIKELGELAETHDVTVFCENAGELKRFSELLAQEHPGLDTRIDLVTGYLHRGFVWDESLPRTAQRQRPTKWRGFVR